MVGPGDLMDLIETLVALTKHHGFSMEYLESLPPYEIEIILATVIKLNEEAEKNAKARK